MGRISLLIYILKNDVNAFVLCNVILKSRSEIALCILLVCFAEECSLRYTITLLRITEPMEDRMEQALFSPPLAKQRVEYALQHIKQSFATNLVRQYLFRLFSHYLMRQQS